MEAVRANCFPLSHVHKASDAGGLVFCTQDTRIYSYLGCTLYTVIVGLFLGHYILLHFIKTV